MPFIFTGGSIGSLIRLECPFCGEVQARAREPEGTLYACRRCHKQFRAPGERPESSKDDQRK